MRRAFSVLIFLELLLGIFSFSSITFANDDEAVSSNLNSQDSRLQFAGLGKIFEDPLRFISLAPQLRRFAETADGSAKVLATDLLSQMEQLPLRVLRTPDDRAVLIEEQPCRSIDNAIAGLKKFGEANGALSGKVEIEKLQNRCQADISSILPKSVRSLVGSHLKCGASAPNCYNASMLFTGLTDQILNSPSWSELGHWLNSSFCRPLGRGEKIEPGDIGTFEVKNKSNMHGVSLQIDHAFVYLSEDVALSKDNAGFIPGHQIVRVVDQIAKFNIPGANYNIGLRTECGKEVVRDWEKYSQTFRCRPPAISPAMAKNSEEAIFTALRGVPPEKLRSLVSDDKFRILVDLPTLNICQNDFKDIAEFRQRFSRAQLLEKLERTQSILSTAKQAKPSAADYFSRPVQAGESRVEAAFWDTIFMRAYAEEANLKYMIDKAWPSK
jgi:hypothetical protein